MQGLAIAAPDNCHSNFQRVDLLWKYFSHKAKTTLGRTAKTGSFMDRMSSFIEDMSKLYLRLYLARNLRRAATSAISAMPSTMTASFGLLGADDAVWIDGEIARLARLAAGAEEQASVLPETPDDHGVRRAVGLDGGDPVVVRFFQALLGPGPGEQAFGAFGKTVAGGLRTAGLRPGNAIDFLWRHENPPL